MRLEKYERQRAFVVAIEGPDGVGKTTQTENLTCMAQARGFKVARVAMPNPGCIFYETIRRFLSDGRAKKEAHQFQAMMIMNRLDWVKTHLPTLLKEKDLILLDRWNASTFAYGTVSGVPMGDTIQLSEPIPAPDMTIFLLGEGYLDHKEEKDSLEKDAEFQAKVRTEFELASMVGSPGLFGKCCIITGDRWRALSIPLTEHLWEHIWPYIRKNLNDMTEDEFVDVEHFLKVVDIGHELAPQLSDLVWINKTAKALLELQMIIHATSKAKGWHDTPRSIGDLIALAHSELSEALEAHRDGMEVKEIQYGEGGKLEGFAVELADTMIRIFDTAALTGAPLIEAVLKKAAFNLTRPHRHGGKKL